MGTLRILLALSVVLVHSGGILGYSMATGIVAVQVFFIISGFFMALVLDEKKDVYNNMAVFYTNRILRIYSTYYVCLLFAVLIYSFIYLNGGTGTFGLIHDNWKLLTSFDIIWLVFVNLFVFGIESSLFLSLGADGLVFDPSGPSKAVWPMILLAPAWSIGLELLFYLIVPYLGRISTRGLTAIAVLSLGGRLALYQSGFNYDPWLYRFFPLEIALFIGGMLSYRCYHRIEAHTSSRARKIFGGLLLAGVLVNQPLLILLNRLSLPDELSRWPFYLFVIVALPCLFALTRRVKWDNRLGEFSYPLYLVHWPIIAVYAWATGLQPEQFRHLDMAASPICAISSLACAWILIFIVEKPVDVFRRKLTNLSREFNTSQV